MHGKLIGVLLAAVALSPFTVYAGEVTAESKISSITVFPHGAQIVRQTQVDVGSGEHTIILRDLPAGTLSDSIQVKGSADGQLTIGSVDVKKIYVPRKDEKQGEKSERKKLEDEIQKLRDDRAALDGKINTAKTQQEYIRELTRLPSRPPRRNDDDQNTQTDWSALFDVIGEKMASLNEEVLKTKIKQREIDHKIADLEKKLKAQPPKRDRRTQVKINVKADKDLKAALKVHYQVRQASWQPFYEARLQTKGGSDKAKLMLTRRASISQRTGEDWTDIAISLSTTRPNEGTSPPVLRPLRVSIAPIRKHKPVGGYLRDESVRQAGKEADALESESYEGRKKRSFARKPIASPAPAKQALIKANAQVRQSTFHAVFDVPGKVTIKSSGSIKKVTIEEIPIVPSLKAIAVPKLRLTAFLSAKFELPKGAPLLRGSVSLHRDGVFIGKGYLPDLNTGANHELGFGVDRAIQVKRSEIDREKREVRSGIISSSKTDERHFKITVKNLHDWKMPVTIMDQLPFSENEKIEVKQLPKTTKPTRSNVKDQRGVLAWDLELAPKQEQNVTLAYRITWPKENEINLSRK